MSEGASTVRNRAMAMYLIPRRPRSACDGTARCRPSVWLPGGLWWPVELDAKRTCGEVWVGWVFGWAGAPGKLDKCPSKAVADRVHGRVFQRSRKVSKGEQLHQEWFNFARLIAEVSDKNGP